MQHRLERSVVLPCRAEEAFSWHEMPGVLERLTPPWVQYGNLKRQGGLEVGATTAMTLKMGPLDLGWKSEHTRYEPGRCFADRMVKGPFASFEHTHTFKAMEGGCCLTDEIRYSLPMEPVSGFLAGYWVKRDLERMFRYRHAITARDLGRFVGRFGRKKPMVAISGASGVIGSALVPFLKSQGYGVKVLVRRRAENDAEIYWNPAKGELDTQGLSGCDVVIHLAGENIGDGRWTPEKRAEIIASREKGTSLLARESSRLKSGPKLFLSASAVGYYGDCGEEPVSEQRGPGDAFISNVCHRWEKTAQENWNREDGRLVILRIGVVLTPAGGALARLLPVFRAGLGGVIGSGNQRMSWISIEDVLGVMAHIMDTPGLKGPVNVTAPHPESNRGFTQTLARTLGRFSFTHVPSSVVVGAFGDMGREILLEGVNALPRALLSSGYTFVHPTLESALSEVI
ncbi:MAG: TIGR01777 family oxidoreductase [Desulfobacterales bacterium]|nr:TIGR01777 family oxidoreductase [Desulfobacterales bacterium]